MDYRKLNSWTLKDHFPMIVWQEGVGIASWMGIRDTIRF